MYIESTEKDSLNLSKDDAERYARMVIRDIAQKVVKNPRAWLQHAITDIRYDENFGWNNLSEEFIFKVIKLAGNFVYTQLILGAPKNKWLLQGKEVITPVAAQEAIQQAINEAIELSQAADKVLRSESKEEQREDNTHGVVRVDIGPPNVNVPSMAAYKSILFAVNRDLIKAFSPKAKISDFLPSRQQLSFFKSTGEIPEGFITTKGMQDICPSCAKDMRKNGILFIKADRFLEDISQRVALDIFVSTDLWAKALQDNDLIGILEEEYPEMNKCEYSEGVMVLRSLHNTAKKKKKRKSKLGKGVSLEELKEKRFDKLVKAVSSKEGFILKANHKPTSFYLNEIESNFLDFLKAHPSAAIKAWAKKMQSEGGEHPHGWCVKHAEKFASDPNAFCAAVHLEAYGKTPMERKADKEEMAKKSTILDALRSVSLPDLLKAFKPNDNDRKTIAKYGVAFRNDKRGKPIAIDPKSGVSLSPHFGPGKEMLARYEMEVAKRRAEKGKAEVGKKAKEEVVQEKVEKPETPLQRLKRQQAEIRAKRAAMKQGKKSAAVVKKKETPEAEPKKEVEKPQEKVEPKKAKHDTPFNLGKRYQKGTTIKASNGKMYEVVNDPIYAMHHSGLSGSDTRVVSYRLKDKDGNLFTASVPIGSGDFPANHISIRDKDFKISHILSPKITAEHHEASQDHPVVFAARKETTETPLQRLKRQQAEIRAKRAAMKQGQKKEVESKKAEPKKEVESKKAKSTTTPKAEPTPKAESTTTPKAESTTTPKAEPKKAAKEEIDKLMRKPESGQAKQKVTKKAYVFTSL